MEGNYVTVILCIAYTQLHGIEVCPLTKTNLRSLDFPINPFFMKLFNISDAPTVAERQSIFDFRLPIVRHFTYSTSLAIICYCPVPAVRFTASVLLMHYSQFIL